MNRKKKMKQYKFFLFDLDGTVLNTEDGILKSIDSALNHLGLPPLSMDQKRSMIGPPIEYSFKKICGLSSECAAKAAAYFREIYPSKFLLEAQEYPGIIKLISTLKADGRKVAIATYKKDRYAQKLMEYFGLTKICDCCLGSDDEGTLTKSDIIKICLQKMGCSEPSEAVMVGDTVHDGIGARQAGIDFWGVSYGYGFQTCQQALDNGAVEAFDCVSKMTERCIKR